MNTTRPCGCKGRRTCLICEEEFGLTPEEQELQEFQLSLVSESHLGVQCDVDEEKERDNALTIQYYSHGLTDDGEGTGTQACDFHDGRPSYVFCPQCGRYWPGWDADPEQLANEHASKHFGCDGSIAYPGGIYVQEDFLSVAEEEELIKSLDDMPWDTSQSGRRKQNFGPKCNFRKKVMKVGDFKGFPLPTRFVQEKFKEVPILQDFITVEQCSLEYDPSRGASIDPHIDDCWVWGERVVTVNLLAHSVLTLTRYNGEDWRYNLPLAPDPTDWARDSDRNGDEDVDVIVRVPMPRRSLIVLTGAARYKWLHSVLRSDVTERRVCLAYRELTVPYLPGGDKWTEAEEVLKRSSLFWNLSNDVPASA